MWIICKIILLDFGLQIFGFGSARTWTWPVTAFAVQFLLLRFLARGGSGIRVLPGLQKALIPFLVLPVCEDLRGGADGKLQMVTNKGIYAFFMWTPVKKLDALLLIQAEYVKQISLTCLCSSRARRRRLAEERSVSSSSCRVSNSSMPIPSSSERPSTAVYLGHNLTCSTGLKS